MKILVTGGTGFIGRLIVKQLLSKQYTVSVLSRQNPSIVRQQLTCAVRPIESIDMINPYNQFDAIINLAGEPIMAKRWSKERKKTLLESRVELTKKLVDKISTLKVKPKLFISASAVGYYGNHDKDNPVDESAESGADFAAILCHHWEQVTQPIEQYNIRKCLLRIGIVLDQNNGILRSMLPVFRLGLGGAIGSGKQMMSWIHIDDLLRIIMLLLHDDQLSGIFNAVSPNPVSNKEFVKSLGETIKRPTVLPIPSFILKTLLGDKASLLTDGQSVIPKALQENGFTWNFPNLSEAFKNILTD